MFNPAKAADEIKKEYIGYISTTYRFGNQKIQRRFEEELDKTVSNGPFVEIKDIFLTGKTINELIDNEVLSHFFRKLESGKRYQPKLPINRPLYLHQEQAIKKIVSGKNVVISTGTGSGKTNCFIIPVLNDLMREQEKGKLDVGVRAIFIYPMNALANDQIKGLREILMNYPDITFGVYNGGSEHLESDAIKLYETMYVNEKYPELKKRLPNEMLSRNEMRDKPPHILFTNYAMLEHLLFRPGDDALFSKSNLKFVVLDEAHVYTGATGIETALLMGRLKGRLNGDLKPQFILTSATLGDGSKESNEMVVRFAKNLTGCDFNQEDIVNASRNTNVQVSANAVYPSELYIDLSNEEKFIKDTLTSYGINFDHQASDSEIIYDLISTTKLFYLMRKLGNLITLDNFAKELNIDKNVAVAFVSLCAKSIKNGKPLIDIRYHYFLRALDGGYLALDHPESFSLIRKDFYKNTDKMFEVAVCGDCGEKAILGKNNGGKLVRVGLEDDREFYQLINDAEMIGFDNNDENDTLVDNKKTTTNKDDNYILCKSCGALVVESESHNKWCTCGNTKPIKVKQLLKGKCLNCNGEIRRLQLGYETATGVISTSLFEQIPEHSFVHEEEPTNKSQKANLFSNILENKRQKIKTGSQFLVFSDSRQGAAKFACFLEESYKEFLRRRCIWKVANQPNLKHMKNISVSDFVKVLGNYFSSLSLFGNSSLDRDGVTVETKRNAWIAALNELYNCNRDTSLVSLGRLQFEYLGNQDSTIDIVVKNFKINRSDAKNLLNYLAMEVVRAGAIETDHATDIGPDDREFIFFTPTQQTITKTKNALNKFAKPFLPTQFRRSNGLFSYYRSNKLEITKRILKINSDEAAEFLEDYWGWLISENNPYRLKSKDGQNYTIETRSIGVHFGENAIVWKCEKCQKVTQFNMGDKCIHPNCDGILKRLDSDEFCKNNYYAMLYKSDKISPLHVKEHTAQLAKKEALDYQQQFIRKEINALSCSTTFEMGVDVGDLETVFLRNIPPLSSNYAQRVGRAGRSINAAAFALTFARLSSHDFTFFDRPNEMINGIIYPPQFKLENEKIIKRHIYAVALGMYLNGNPKLYNRNNAKLFINEKGYEDFLNWINSKPESLLILLKNSIPSELWRLSQIQLDEFGWLNDFCGQNGRFTAIIGEFEKNIDYLQQEREKAIKAGDLSTAQSFEKRLTQYCENQLIDFLVRGNILPKYGFPVDSVELTQNISSQNYRSLSLNRDLSIAIAEYAPSAEVVADGKLYTSRYIKKSLVNKVKLSSFDISYIAQCPDCQHINYRNMPIGIDGQPCSVCQKNLTTRDFYNSIEPRSGFIAEEHVKRVPMNAQERKYRTEAIYIGDKDANLIDTFEYQFGKVKIKVESTTNDSLVVKSTEKYYVCSSCGYSLASDEASVLNNFSDFKNGVYRIKDGPQHLSPFGKGKCENTELSSNWLHHEFKTDVAKISFDKDTEDLDTMLSVMYALLNSFADTLSIEKRDIKACLTYKRVNGKYEHKIIIYDAVPGGAGHSRRLVTEDGMILKQILIRAKQFLSDCTCEPSCYKCLRSYENQKIHEILDRRKALAFLTELID